MTQPAKTFKDLIVWQKAHEFVSEQFTFRELFGEFVNAQHFSVSPGSNLNCGEPRGRLQKAQRSREVALPWDFRGIFGGMPYYLILSEDLEYGVSSRLADGLEDVSRLLGAYAKAMGRSAKRQA